MSPFRFPQGGMKQSRVYDKKNTCDERLRLFQFQQCEMDGSEEAYRSLLSFCETNKLALMRLGEVIKEGGTVFIEC